MGITQQKRNRKKNSISTILNTNEKISQFIYPLKMGERPVYTDPIPFLFFILKPNYIVKHL